MRPLWGPWLHKLGFIWLTAVMILATAMVLWMAHAFTGCKERDVRVLSLMLQGLGFWIVWLGLRDISLHFRSPTLLAQLGNLWAERPFLRRAKSFSIQAQGVMSVAVTGQGRVRVGAGPDASLESRLEFIEKELAFRDVEFAHFIQTHNAAKESLKTAITEEEAKRAQGDADLLGTITSTLAGGITLERLGVCYFLFGMILSSVAPEVAMLFGHSGSCTVPLTF